MSNVTKFRPLKNIKEYSVVNSLFNFFFGLNPFTNDGNFSCVTKLKKRKERTLKLTHSTPCVHGASKRIEVLKGDEIKFCRTLILGKQNRK